MHLLQAIESRRSIGKVKQKPVDREKIEALLKLATYAPNHRMTEPWRFFVMQGDGRRVLGDAYRDIAFEKATDLSGESRTLIATTQQKKAKRAPVIVAVATSFRSHDEIERTEDRAATYAAIQNILLGAHGMGLGAIWRSGAPMYHPRMKKAFGLGDNDEILGLVYIGYPEEAPVPKQRTSFLEVTTWMD
ncbi:nitroreductase [Pullulanibacillus pueri]|uniref:Putative NAD(P)H nitroreductase n=1 Tax=Pullulanibacillus pueri TaxID=1437324 RepID=A0A8J2ZU69_9BACL|nr:nitroreductase [Pullulanibacillus pueri]MBM7681227.1 nitroreductase [Pullulanibacillus pueri]GGH77963.1 putative NAD(P)H nitroreductase YfhC [Pullulanibacillus pueri]